MNSALFLALRRLRHPLIALVAIYAFGMLGLVLIPGVDEQGEPWHMSFFDAFYFLSYTASTIGFGELPRPFSYPQRLWVTAIVYLSVLGWAYTIGTLLALSQDRSFRLTLTQQRFAGTVRRLREPFYLVCGCGETGTMVCRALDRLGVRCVVLDIDESRIAELDLIDFQADVPGLVADARLPENLLLAGLKNPCCSAVLALTSDDAANLAVAMATRLLHPGVPVLARAMDRSMADNMASFGTDHIINPFKAFGDYLALAIHAPGQFRLGSLLTGLLQANDQSTAHPPRGQWIVCGYGRFGREVVACFEGEGLDVAIIDPEPDGRGQAKYIRGTGTEAQPLRAAGADRAVGIVAGTDDDVDNLSIAVTAREINPRLFVILRQNLQANRALFDAFGADMIMVPSQLIGFRCLALLTTPMLDRFLALVREQTDAWAETVYQRLRALVGEGTPRLWTVTLTAAEAPAVHAQLGRATRVLPLEILSRDPGDRATLLECMPLMLLSAGREALLPTPDTALTAGDRVLFAGRSRARRAQTTLLRNAKVLDYVRSGRELPGGWVWEWLRRRNRGALVD